MGSTSERLTSGAVRDGAPVPRRPDASMTLLADAVSGALDPSYADARARVERRAARAARSAVPTVATLSAVPVDEVVAGRVRRRATRPAGPAGPQTEPVAEQVDQEDDEPSSWRLAPWVVLALLGLVTGLAVAQVRRGDSGITRTDLLADVRQQTRQAASLEGRAAALRAQLATTREQALATQAEQRAVALTLTAARTGSATSALTGPGLVVTLSDAPGSNGTGSGRGGQLASDRIFDSDLQAVTNALWAAGAEAITVNGLRLTAQTAIREAGEAILVDFRALSSPYVVRALGDPRQLQQTFADDPAAVRLTSFSTQYGLGFSTQRAARLSVPAGSTAALRHATPLSATTPLSPSTSGSRS